MVFANDQATHRQFQITHRTINALIALVVVSIVGLGAASWFSYRGFANKEKLAKLEAENQLLKDANDRYLVATIETEKKLRYFDEKTTKLAQFVGVEPQNMERGGIGGADIFDESELNQYLRYDLGLLASKATALENRLDTLDTAFQDHREALESTPSIIPTRGWISSAFAYRMDPFTQQRTWHNGLDISCPSGTPIYAPASGVVTFRGYQGGFGNLIVLKHGKNLETKYAHLSKFNVSKGDRVMRGDLIGYVGATGRSTAPHLHYEIHQDGQAVNPMSYIFEDSATY